MWLIMLINYLFMYSNCLVLFNFVDLFNEQNVFPFQVGYISSIQSHRIKYPRPLHFWFIHPSEIKKRTLPYSFLSTKVHKSKQGLAYASNKLDFFFIFFLLLWEIENERQVYRSQENMLCHFIQCLIYVSNCFVYHFSMYTFYALFLSVVNVSRFKCKIK